MLAVSSLIRIRMNLLVTSQAVRPLRADLVSTAPMAGRRNESTLLFLETIKRNELHALTKIF